MMIIIITIIIKKKKQVQKNHREIETWQCLLKISQLEIGKFVYNYTCSKHSCEKKFVTKNLHHSPEESSLITGRRKNGDYGTDTLTHRDDQHYIPRLTRTAPPWNTKLNLKRWCVLISGVQLKEDNNYNTTSNLGHIKFSPRAYEPTSYPSKITRGSSVTKECIQVSCEKPPSRMDSNRFAETKRFSCMSPGQIDTAALSLIQLGQKTPHFIQSIERHWVGH